MSPNLESFLEDDDDDIHNSNNDVNNSVTEQNTTSILINNTKEEELLKQVAVLQQKLSSMQAETSLLRNDLSERDAKIQEIEDENNIHIQALQSEVEKEKRNVNELVRLLEGLSTNSDQLPTGQVEHTTNAPLDDYLLRRCTSNDSVQSMEELQDDSINNKNEFTESGSSFKQQMSLNVERYEKQISELQQLYDQDVFALEKEKDTLVNQLEKLKEQCASANSSSQITTEKAKELEENYSEKINQLESEYKKRLDEERTNWSRDMSTLKEENDKLNNIIQSNELEYSTMRDAMLLRTDSDAQEKIQDMVGKLIESMGVYSTFKYTEGSVKKRFLL